MSAIRTIFAEFPDFTLAVNFLRMKFFFFGAIALTVVAFRLYVQRYRYRASHQLGTGRHSGTPVDPFFIARFQGKTGFIRHHAA